MKNREDSFSNGLKKKNKKTQKKQSNVFVSYSSLCGLFSSFKIVEYILYQFSWLRLYEESNKLQ